MRGGPEDSSLLSLTFDQGTPGDAKPAKRRPRSAGRTLRASFAAPVAAGAPAPAGARPAPAGPFPPRKVTPPLAEGDVLALQLGATPRQVQVWFQNKRQRRAGKAKREQEAANGLTSSGVQDSHYPTQTSPLPSVPETVSTAALFDLPTLAPGAAPPPASAPTDPQQNHQQPSLSVYVPPSPEGAVAAQSSGAHATTGGAPSAAGAASPSPTT